MLLQKTYSDGCIVTVGDETVSLSSTGVAVVSSDVEQYHALPSAQAVADHYHFTYCHLVTAEEDEEAIEAWEAYLNSQSCDYVQSGAKALDEARA